MKVVLLPQAREDLDFIYDPLFSKITRRLQLLKDYPEMGVPMLGPFTGYRSLVVGLFRIVYRVRESSIEIAYIRHCRRRPLA